MAPPKTERSRRIIAVWLSLVLLATACTSSDTAHNADGSADSSSTTTLASTTTVAPTGATSESVDEASETATPARIQLDWLVTVLSSGESPDLADIEAHFSPAFLQAVPSDQLIAAFPELASLAEAPLSIESSEQDADGLGLEAVLVGADGRRVSVDLVVTPAAPNLIEGVLLAPMEFESTGGIEELDDRLTSFGAQSSLGVYRVEAGECIAEHEIRADEQIVLGSVFKLWLLAALATEIDEGRASWDETVTLTDELRSNPAGDIYELETGTELSLEELAGRMISQSDNTATDLLLDRLGRGTVEATLSEIGLADPSANVPLLSTGNLWALKYYPDGPDADDYRALDETGRRALLAELDAEIAPWVGVDDPVDFVLSSQNSNGVPIGEPRDLDIEWFATPMDLCRTFVHLSDLAETPGLEQVSDILAVPPDGLVPFDRETWPTIWFKGGSEAGVIAGAWWFEGTNGERYVVAGGVSDPDSAIAEETNTVLALASAIDLVS